MKNNLSKYSMNVSSQFGEDGIIQRIFEILPKQEVYWCVEFGAWDGKFLSNTYELISSHGWSGVLIEGNKSKFPQLQKTYAGNNNVTLINKLVQFEGTDTLDNILAQTKIPADFDLLSIDIDGNDYHVWDSLQKYFPRIVIVEFNPSIPGDVEFVQQKKFSINHGNSLLSMIKLGKSKGYEIIATTACNAFFVKKEYFDLFEISDNSISEIWETEKEAPRVFQLYDGTLVLTEEFTMIWGKDKVDKYDLQKYPRFLRHFGDSTSGKGLKVLKKIYYKLRSVKK